MKLASATVTTKTSLMTPPTSYLALLRKFSNQQYFGHLNLPGPQTNKKMREKKDLDSYEYTKQGLGHPK